MHILSAEEKAAAEFVRLQRAFERHADYTLTRRGLTDTFTVEGGTRPYITSAHTCTCPDHTNRGLDCIHCQMVQARLLADGNVVREARRASVLSDRALWG